MSDEYIIRNMRPDELQIAIDWANREGWNPGLHDQECFYKADPDGFFIGILNGEPISTGAAVIYDDHFAFCGLYIVKPECRGSGYGLQLTQVRLDYVGDRITGIDGVINNVSKYQRIGYVPAHKNITYAFTPTEIYPLEPYVVDLKNVPFDELMEFDRRYFPGARSEFIRCWITQPGCYAYGYLEEGDLDGYIVMRKCVKGYKIGPLFAESLEIAHALFRMVCSKVKGELVSMCVPESNMNAIILAESYNMTPQMEIMRMYRNGFPDIDLDGVFGVTSYELG